MAVPYDDLINGSLNSVAFRCKLALLDGSVDEDVVALFEGLCDSRKIAVERQIVPIRLLLRFAVPVLVSVAFTQANVGDRRSRRKIAGDGFGR